LFYLLFLEKKNKKHLTSSLAKEYPEPCEIVAGVDNFNQILLLWRLAAFRNLLALAPAAFGDLFILAAGAFCSNWICGIKKRDIRKKPGISATISVEFEQEK
jgi:hypothetical protein